MKTLSFLAGIINLKKQFGYVHLSKMANLAFRAITLDKMDSLIQEFKKLYKKEGLIDSGNGFISDGIIDEVKYKNQKHKILFIAKEHNHLNDSYQEGSYSNWWNTEDGVRYGFSHRLSEWAYGIISDFQKEYNEITYADKLTALQSIAFINIKKTYGGATANPIVLANYVDKTKDLLHQQIRNISPTIIVCCLRYNDLLKQLFDPIDMIDTGHGFSYGIWNTKMVINFYHPSARKNKVELYKLLKRVTNVATSNLSAY